MLVYPLILDGSPAGVPPGGDRHYSIPGPLLAPCIRMTPDDSSELAGRFAGNGMGIS